MEFTNLFHHWLKDQNPLNWGTRFVYATGSGGGPTGSGAPSAADQGQTPAEPPASKEARDRQAEELEEGRNREMIQKLDQLTTRTVISGPTAEQAKKGLKSNDHQMRSLSRMLANQEISEDVYTAAHDCLASDNSTRKALARKLVSGKVSTDIFQDALDDFEGGDQYKVPLVRRFAHGRIDQQEFDLASTGLTDPDPDVQRACQMLAMGYMEPAQFRSELGMEERRRTEAETHAEQHVTPVEATQKRTHDLIVDLLLRVGVVIEQLPEEERTRPLLRLQRNLDSLNIKDKANRSGLFAYLRKLSEEENLSGEQEAEIREFDADTKEDFKVFRKRLEAMKLSDSAVKNILRLKMEEWNIEEEYIRQTKIADEILRATTERLNYETLKLRMIEKASEMAGFKIKEGTRIQYVYPDPSRGNIRTMAIKEVRVVDAPILDGTGADAKPIGRQPSNLIIFLDNGEEYSIGRFLKWIDGADVHETIQSQADLEKSLELPEVGMTLKPGQGLDYRTGYTRDAKGNIVPQRGSVKIVSIGDGGVVLDQPVVTLTPEEAPHAGLTAPRMSREMNLGEFAKWARRNEMVPKINTLSQLQDHLRQNNTAVNNKRGRTASAYLPIRVEPGELLQYGDLLPDQTTRQFQIKKADDNGVTFADGTAMTLPQFLGWVRKNDVERSNPEDVADRAEDAAQKSGLPESDQEKVKKDWLDKAKKDLENGHKNHKDGHSGLEHAHPHEHEVNGILDDAREFMAHYTFVSVIDLWNMVKEIWEFLKRKHQRNSKGRYSKIGKHLPGGLGAEFLRVELATEAEEVKKYEESMHHMGTDEILERLHETHNKDEGKAAFNSLTERGELRWDDMEMWGTLNRLTASSTTDGAQLFIQHTKELQRDPKTGNMMAGEDRTKAAIDAIWGQGTWAGWFSKNINAYNNGKNAYEHKGKQLEADPKGTKGLRGELTRLLKEWKSGHYVNPQEYEELIDFAMKYGKLGTEGRMFFLMEGVTAVCPSGPAKGMTLLHMDRIGDLDGKYLNVFPPIDFLTNKGEKPFHPKYLNGEVKEIPKGGYKPEDIEAFRDEFYRKESEGCEPQAKFSQFLWEWIIVDPQFKTRLSKGLRHAENMDHDDAQLFLPPMSMQEINNVTGSVNGTQKFFSNPAYKNAYTGYGQYLISLSNRYEELLERKKAGQPISDAMIKENADQMLGGLQGYYLYDSYLSGRRDQTDDRRARLDTSHFNETAVVDSSFIVGGHKAQMDSLLKEICDAYGIPWQQLQLFDYKPRYNEQDKQRELTSRMEEFLQNTLPQAIRSDPRIMYDIVKRRKQKASRSDAASKEKDALRGIKGSNRLLTWDTPGSGDAD